MNIWRSALSSLAVFATALSVFTVSSLVIFAIDTPAAQARMNTLNLTCSQAKNLVRSQRAIVLSTGRYTYDRYVVSRAFCPTGDYVKRAFVPTRDRKSCNIGYICTMDNPLESIFDRHFLPN